MQHNVQHLASSPDFQDSKPHNDSDIITLFEHKGTKQELDMFNITNYKTACYYAKRLGRGVKKYGSLETLIQTY